MAPPRNPLGRSSSLRSMNRLSARLRRLDPRVLTVMACAGAALVVTVTPGAPWDFAYDWLTSRAFVTGEDPLRPLSDLAASQDLQTELESIHPRTPGALLLQAPIAPIPWTAVVTAGQCLVAAATVWLTWMAGHALHRPWLVLTAPALLLVPPFTEAMWTGNTAILVAALIMWTWHSGSGWGVGLAATLKVWPWLLVPALFVSGHRRVAAQAAGAIAALNILPLALPNVSVGQTIAAATDAQQHAERSLSPLALGFGSSIAVGAVIVVIIWWRNWSPLLSIPAALAISPILWASYLAALLVPVVYAASGMAPTSSSDGGSEHRLGASGLCGQTGHEQPKDSKRFRSRRRS